MFNSQSSELLWFIIGLVLLLGELVVPGFVIVFFGIGAWITALGVALGLLDSFNLQLAVFLGSSVLSLVLFRKKGKRYFEGRVSGRPAPERTMEDVGGERALVVSDIVPNSLGGKVEYNGTLWEAQSSVPISKGRVVEIVERSNLILKVKPLEEKGETSNAG